MHNSKPAVFKETDLLMEDNSARRKYDNLGDSHLEGVERLLRLESDPCG